MADVTSVDLLMRDYLLATWPPRSPQEPEPKLTKRELLIPSVISLRKHYFQELLSYLNERASNVKNFADILSSRREGLFAGVRIVCAAEEWLWVSGPRKSLKLRRMVRLTDQDYSEMEKVLRTIYETRRQEEDRRLNEKKVKIPRCRVKIESFFFFRYVEIVIVLVTRPPHIFQQKLPRQNKPKRTGKRNRSAHGLKIRSRISQRKEAMLLAMLAELEPG